MANLKDTVVTGDLTVTGKITGGLQDGGGNPGVVGEGTIGTLAKWVGANLLDSSSIQQNDSKDIIINGKVFINQIGSESNNSCNEGIRIGPASNGWSEIFFAEDSNSEPSGNFDGWLMGRRGEVDRAPRIGEVGDFTIEYGGSTGTGLTLFANGDQPAWNGHQLVVNTQLTGVDNYIAKFEEDVFGRPALTNSRLQEHSANSESTNPIEQLHRCKMKGILQSNGYVSDTATASSTYNRCGVQAVLARLGTTIPGWDGALTEWANQVSLDSNGQVSIRSRVFSVAKDTLEHAMRVSNSESGFFIFLSYDGNYARSAMAIGSFWYHYDHMETKILQKWNLTAQLVSVKPSSGASYAALSVESAYPHSHMIGVVISAYR